LSGAVFLPFRHPIVNPSDRVGMEGGRSPAEPAGYAESGQVMIVVRRVLD